MATRSFVGVMVGDVCRAVYVHWDGYLDCVGNDLQAYKTQEDVEELIGHGDRSCLQSEFYKDAGEAWDEVRPANYYTFESFFNSCMDAGCEYYYIFKDGVWYCGNTYGGERLYKTLTPFQEALEIEEEEHPVDVA